MQQYIPLICGLVALACGLAILYRRKASAKPAAKRVDPKGDKDTLVAAVLEWCGDNDGIPQCPADARLHQAVWRYEGDRKTGCPGCDLECDEPCRPTTAKAAIASLDRWIADWMKKRGITQHTA